MLYAVSDAVVDHYIEVAAELQLDLEELEAEVFAPVRRDTKNTAAEIYAFKREVLEFRRATGPLAEPMARLQNPGVPFVHDHARPFFRDVDDHLTRANESVEGLDRLLSDILSAHLAQMGVRQNDDMRKISAWAALAAVPTLIAGIYGMNFDYMPELQWHLGYPAIAAGDGHHRGVAVPAVQAPRLAVSHGAGRPGRRAAGRTGPPGAQANSGAEVAGPPSASRRSGIRRLTIRRQPPSRS